MKRFLLALFLIVATTAQIYQTTSLPAPQTRGPSVAFANSQGPCTVAAPGNWAGDILLQTSSTNTGPWATLADLNGPGSIPVAVPSPPAWLSLLGNLQNGAPSAILSCPSSSIVAHGPINGTIDGVYPSPAPTGPYYYNLLTINNDALAGTFIGTDQASNGFGVHLNFGGANASGGRSAITSILSLTATTNSGSTDRDYVAGTFAFESFTSDGGTNTGAGAKGNGVGINPSCFLGGTATNFLGCGGAEFDVTINNPATASYRVGASFVSIGDTNGAVGDAALMLGSTTGAVKWLNGLYLANINGQAPIATTGCIICTDGSTATIATGIDLTGYTITGNLLKTANMTLSGSGNFTSAGAGLFTFGYYTGTSLYGPTSATINGPIVAVGADNGLDLGNGSTVFRMSSDGRLQLTSQSGVVEVNGGIKVDSVSATCGAASGIPCVFTWTCTMSSGSCTTTHAVPAAATCTLEPSVSPILSTTNVAQHWVTLASTTLTVHVHDELGTSSAAFSGIGSCL